MTRATPKPGAVARVAAGIAAALVLATCGDPSLDFDEPDLPGLQLGTSQRALDLDGKWSPVVTPIGPDALPDLPYWPFTDTIPDKDEQWDEARPVLVASVIDQPIDSAGCGKLAWREHPIPGTYVPGPFCVALYRNAKSAPLLVVGRPGYKPRLLVPARDVVAVSALPDGSTRIDERRIGMGPVPAGARELLRRWAKNPVVEVQP